MSRQMKSVSLRSAIALALAAVLSGTVVHAQSTTGSIIGQAPVVSGETVLIQGSNGLTREVPVDSRGRYSAVSLPLATYTVSLQQNGKTLDTRDHVTLRVGIATNVSFSATASANTSPAGVQQLSTVSVSANALPPIDVTSTGSSTIITAEQMARLPLARTAEAVALLAPGALPASTYFHGAMGNTLVSFSGSAATENAYYINGFNTTDPLSGFGGITLPYGAVEQEEILNGGYSAAYGRSDGGVISQVGKRGTNQWHFGAQVLWQPAFAQNDQRNIYYARGSKAGQIFQRKNQNKSWETTVDAYAGGPLIKDRLYVFAAVEAKQQQGNTISDKSSTPANTRYTYKDPKSYLKLDWNINDSNILELTGVSQTHRSDASDYAYDYDSGSTGGFVSKDTTNKTSAKIYVAKFTSYITDDLTLSAMYGKSSIDYFTQVPDSGVDGPSIRGLDQENPAYVGNQPRTNGQTIDVVNNPSHRSTNRNLRLDLTYKIGDHSITAGIDNQDSHDIDDGATIGSGYELWYGKGDPNTDISESPFVDAPGKYPGGEEGYFGYIRHYSNSASVRVKQRAQYVEDHWQVTDRLMLQLGIRNDQFTNYNPAGAPYLRLTSPQWAPRLGFSWDVHGDSSLKVYGNAGRYYLAMPASVALRTAAGSIATNQYFTYTGIDANGMPTGMTFLKSSTGGAVSPNGEYGQPPDPKTVSAQNIKSEYQDEFILGFDQQINPKWLWGMKGTVRHLRNALDDVCDNGAIGRAAQAQGADLSTLTIGSCYLSNPGRANTYDLVNASGGYTKVTVTNKDFGFPQLKRNYDGLEVYLSHPFDGKWSGKIDYVWSHSYGNTEGQVTSFTGQQNVSATRDWDYYQLMLYANGDQGNDRRHALKIYGSYQIAPEWMVSANLSILSGLPKECLGFFGTQQNDPVGYGSYYHYCDGQPSPPGKVGSNPWQEIITGSVEYRPQWADHKLAFNLMVYNLLNQQRPLQISPGYGSSKSINDSYERVIDYTMPRYVRFGISYDF
ncbi:MULTISPECIES: TonB-dependent receptor [Rhodanobacter]|uniref:Outer membrane receptor proteins, mostly Fe transport n=1 Tax=Rhodanobacter glycinis TaxID=582702 RepID=A0A1I3Z6S6_9GAMM|nr:TonB-dependent receptor [Rhodanobacter glycinis]SFK39798.1 Outer membrane receptor proteins, mostly Fe transport [Rhodanobacter glycinis]